MEFEKKTKIEWFEFWENPNEFFFARDNSEFSDVYVNLAEFAFIRVRCIELQSQALQDVVMLWHFG